MGRVNDTISNVNSALRNLLLTALVAIAGIGGYKVYDIYNKPQQMLASKEAELEKVTASLKQANEDLTARQKEIRDLNTDLAAKTAQVDHLKVAMKLLQVEHRLARLKVLDQREVPSLNPVTPKTGTEKAASPVNLLTTIEFAEINKEGKSIGEAKKFEIVGDMVYVDYLHVTFEDKFIEQSDLNRSTSLALFQRIFGEHQEAADGFQLDKVGTRPLAYGAGADMSEFEKRIWNDFWLIANDPERAKEMGIRAANGQAIAIRMVKGKTYEIDLRATGNMSFRVAEPSPPPAIAPSGS